MKLQYTTDCALRMMVCLTGEDRIVSSREMEEKIGFPQQCIFNAGRKLKQAGYVHTISGPFGGYTLGKLPEEITIQDILALFKDSFSVCGAQAPVSQLSTTTLRNFVKLLGKLEDDVIQKMSSFTLADLLVETNPSDIAI